MGSRRRRSFLHSMLYQIIQRHLTSRRAILLVLGLVLFITYLLHLEARQQQHQVLVLLVAEEVQAAILHVVGAAYVC